MDCTVQIQHWFYLCLALCGVILAMLAMFFGYNLKLGTRTAQLEKKNGKEQKQLDQLKERMDKLERSPDDLDKSLENKGGKND